MLGLLAAAVLGLSAGAMLAEGAVLVPFWRASTPEAFLAWYAAHAALLLHFFGPLEIAGAVLAVAAAVLSRWQGRAGSGALAGAAALAVAVLAPFPLYFQAANAAFADGTIPPGRVASELGVWATWHWIRTAIGGAAFVASLLGVRGASAPRDA